ncbi:MAG: glycosyltransferase family 4 protein [Candidatus Synoicihabitans palmerolidicus]|nr:glycosyltransferase family 4 protein [Candidatus Synoicihabitans palmerolidicus]
MANTGCQRTNWMHQVKEIEKRGDAVRVDFPGWLNPGEVSHLIRKSDGLVVPSLWAEPFGLIEAGPQGCPVVAFDRGGISEWLKDGYNGCLASSVGDLPSTLADSVVRCVTDPCGKAHWERNAKRVGEHFDLSHHFKRWMGTLVQQKAGEALIEGQREWLENG